jgi:hypothetical protein
MQEQTETAESQHERLLEEIQAVKKQLEIQNRMIRALVVHSGMDESLQHRILQGKTDSETGE